jgi:hypothetical protein
MEVVVELGATEIEPHAMLCGVRLVDDTDRRCELIGTEEEILAMLGRVAELFNATVEYRDPGPCERCAASWHSTNDHDAALLQGIKDEIAEHNRNLGAK